MAGLSRRGIDRMDDAPGLGARAASSQFDEIFTHFIVH
jgi:hypothetical protein